MPETAKVTAEEIKENRRLWAEALRSGEFVQGKGALRGGGKYCCLGVACVVLHKKYGSKDLSPVPARNMDDPVSAWGRVNSLLGNEALAKLGLDYYGDRDTDQHRFTRANDEFGRDFKEIASMVEGLSGDFKPFKVPKIEADYKPTDSWEEKKNDPS